MIESLEESGILFIGGSETLLDTNHETRVSKALSVLIQQIHHRRTRYDPSAGRYVPSPLTGRYPK